MADYSGLEEYTTPDGRTIRLPPALAQNFSQSLTQVQPPQMGAPTMMVDPQAPTNIGPLPGVASSGQPPLPVDASPLPDMPAPAPGPVVPASAQPLPVNAQEPRTPTPQSMRPDGALPATEQDLSRVGFSGVYQAQAGALEQAAQAGQRLADAEANEQTAMADAYKARNAKLEADAIELRRIQEAAARADQERAIKAEGAMKAWSDHKVDRSMDHPILGAIAMAMGAIGSAMQGSNQNPALDIIMKQMDRKVQLQLADRDKLKDVAGQARSDAEFTRRAGQDKIAQYHLAMAGEADRWLPKVAEIKSRSGVEKVRANGDLTMAGIAEKKASHLSQGVERIKSIEQQEAARKQQSSQFNSGLAEQRAGRLQGQNQFDQNLAFQREKEANDLKQASLTAGAKGADVYSKLAKENEERGIRDPVTGEILLSAQGRKLTEDAAKLDKDAAAMRTAGKPGGDEQARLYEAKAAQLRNEARYDHAIRGRSADQAAKAQQTVGGAQSMLSLIDKIKARAAKSGTKVINQSEMQAALETEMSLLGLEVKDLYTLGSLDEGAARYMDKISGGDPSKLTTSGFLGAIGIGADSSEKTAAKLDALGKQVEARGYSALSGLGVKPGDFKFRRDDAATRPESKAAAGLLDAKTPLESAAGEERGAAGKVVERVFNPFGERPSERRARASEERQSLKYPGLSPEQEPYMSQLLAQSKGDGAEAINARNKLVAIAADQSRPSVSTAVVHVLREEDPALYAEAVKQLPDEAREVYEVLDRGVDVKARTTVGPLIPQYRGGR